MNWHQIIFFIFAFIALASAVMVVASRNPVRAVLFLVVTFFAAAGIWLLAQAEFLALILVVVYVGAVMTLFLFVVMMMNVETMNMKRHLLRHLPIGIGVVVLLAGLMFVAIKPEVMRPEGTKNIVPMETKNNTKALGQVLYTDYAYPFEIAGVLLLVAIIAAISLVHRPTRRGTRAQQINDQISVRKEDRLRVVKMKVEKNG